MDDFKLIAIRPLKNCNPNFVKVLKTNAYYYFFSGYKIENEKVVAEPEKDIDLYSQENLRINISAIVGKNGSGKSSLIELLYLTMFSLAVKAEILPKKNEDGEEVVLEDNLRVEVWFKVGGNFVKLTILGDICSITIDEEVTQIDGRLSGKAKQIVQNLFYVIAINYSHHSLNRRHVGEWVKNIFHKNDGYQTPIVINPYREEGNFNINLEEDLTLSRLLSNLIIIGDASEKEKEKIRTLIPNKKVTKVKFTYNEAKKKDVTNPNDKVNKLLSEHERSMFSTLTNRYNLKLKNQPSKIGDLEFAQKYLLRKLYNISEKYTKYREKYRFLENGVYSNFKLFEFLDELKRDKSHIAFKVNQTINFFESPDFYADKNDEWIDIDVLNDHIRSLTNEKSRVIDFLPPSIFKVDLMFEKGELFSNLSSGERQKLFATATYKYHLFNLDSVQNGLRYKNVLLVFDEIELYYHPELQRTFISDFLDALDNMKFESIKALHAIFVTHSPFILSDIPSQNTVFLDIKEGKSIISQHMENNFGANIHELLKLGFFMKEGLMGKFAVDKIENFIRTINESKKISEDDFLKHLEFVNLIGEPIIRNRLIDILNDKRPFQEQKSIDKQIQELEAQIIELRKEAKKNASN